MMTLLLAPIAALMVMLAPPRLGPVDAEALMGDLVILSSDDMAGRAPGTEGSERARAHILARFQALGVEPGLGEGGWLQAFRVAPSERAPAGVQGLNIVGRVEGRTHPDRYIVITAHYDHEGVRNGQVYNGADDNASGTAALIELARLLQQTPPDHSVLLVALDAEEQGLLGAQAFLEDPPVPIEAMVLNLNLDMIARGDNGILWAVGTHQTPALADVIDNVPTPPGLTLMRGHDTPGDIGRDNWVGLSDQAAFFARGVPFIFFSVDDHPDYHQPTDDAERIDRVWYSQAVWVIHAAFRLYDRSLAGARPQGRK